jgi:hypothetical protein
MNLSCNIAIGNLSFNFHCPSASWLKFLEKHYRPFFCQRTKSKSVNITIKPGISKLHLPKKLQIIEDNSALRLLRYDFSSTSADKLENTILYVVKNKYAFDSWFRVFFTLDGINRDSVLIHSAGFVFKNKAYIFPGRSGLGKSTLIKILGKESALTDELVCVYRKNRAYYAASTPYWGELKKGSGKVFNRPLKAILCPGHGSRVYKTELSKQETLRQLLRTILFFSQEARAMKKLLAFLHALSLHIPACTLWFRKDSKSSEIVEFF